MELFNENEFPSHLTQIRFQPVHRSSDFIGGTGSGPVRGPMRKLSSSWIKQEEKTLSQNVTALRPCNDSNKLNTDLQASTRNQSKRSTNSSPMSKVFTKENLENVVPDQILSEVVLPSTTIKKCDIPTQNETSSHTLLSVVDDPKQSIPTSNENESTIAQVDSSIHATSNNDGRAEKKLSDVQTIKSFSDEPNESNDTSESTYSNHNSSNNDSSLSVLDYIAPVRSNYKPNEFIGGYKEKTTTYKAPTQSTQHRALDSKTSCRDFIGGCGDGPTPPRRKTLSTPEWLSSSQLNYEHKEKPIAPVRSLSSEDRKQPSFRTNKFLSRNRSYDISNSSERECSETEESESPQNIVVSTIKESISAKDQMINTILSADIDPTCKNSNERNNCDTLLSSVISDMQNDLSNSSDDSLSFLEVTAPVCSNNKPNEFIGGYKEKTTTYKAPTHITQHRALDSKSSCSDFIGGCGDKPVPPRRKTMSTPGWLSFSKLNYEHREKPIAPARSLSSDDRKQPSFRTNKFLSRNRSYDISNRSERECSETEESDSLENIVVSATKESVISKKDEINTIVSVDIDPAYENSNKSDPCSNLSGNMLTLTDMQNESSHSSDDSLSFLEMIAPVCSNNKPNEFIGGYKEKITTYKAPTHIAQHRALDSKSSCTEFIGGCGDKPVPPRRKTISTPEWLSFSKLNYEHTEKPNAPSRTLSCQHQKQPSRNVIRCHSYDISNSSEVEYSTSESDPIETITPSSPKESVIVLKEKINLTKANNVDQASKTLRERKQSNALANDLLPNTLDESSNSNDSADLNYYSSNKDKSLSLYTPVRASYKPNDFIGGYKEKKTTCNTSFLGTQNRARDNNSSCTDFIGGCGDGPTAPRRKKLSTPEWLSSSQLNYEHKDTL